MNHKYYHTPVNPDSNRARCPVCREQVYSLSGIHPQCAAKRGEAMALAPVPVVVGAEIIKSAAGAEGMLPEGGV